MEQSNPGFLCVCVLFFLKDFWIWSGWCITRHVSQLVVLLFVLVVVSGQDTIENEPKKNRRRCLRLSLNIYKINIGCCLKYLFGLGAFTTEYLKKLREQVLSHPLKLHSESRPAGLRIFLHLRDNWLFSSLISSPWGVIFFFFFFFQKQLIWQNVFSLLLSL